MKLADMKNLRMRILNEKYAIEMSEIDEFW